MSKKKLDVFDEGFSGSSPLRIPLTSAMHEPRSDLATVPDMSANLLVLSFSSFATA